MAENGIEAEIVRLRSRMETLTIATNRKKKKKRLYVQLAPVGLRVGGRHVRGTT